MEQNSLSLLQATTSFGASSYIIQSSKSDTKDRPETGDVLYVLPGEFLPVQNYDTSKHCSIKLSIKLFLILNTSLTAVIGLDFYAHFNTHWSLILFVITVTFITLLFFVCFFVVVFYKSNMPLSS